MRKTLTIIVAVFSFTLTYCQSESETPKVDSKKLVFIHHSTGGRLISDNWGTLGMALNGAGYFLSDICYQWDATLNNDIGNDTDIGHWWVWFMDQTVQSNGIARRDNIMQSVYVKSTKDDYGISRYGDYTRTINDPGGENEIIIFKSCYPNSDILADNATTPEDIFGTYAGHTSYTETNVRVVYDTILNYFKAHPNKLFIVLTAPPNRETSNGARARSFNNWLVKNWLQDANWQNKNVYVYDYYNVLTDVDNHHWVVNGTVVHYTDPSSSNNSGAYLGSPTDNYPSKEGQEKVAAEFVPVLNYWYSEWEMGQDETLVTAITVSGDGGATTITTGGTLQLSAAVSPLNATNQTVTWSKINGTGQATISSSGLMTAVTSGTVTATASANDGSGVEGEISVTINNPVLTGNGTFANPFSGTVNSNISWNADQFINNTVYVRGIIINPGFTLTIGRGVTVLTTLDGYMTVSGTLDIGPGAGYTSRDIINNSTGTIRLNSDAIGIASIIISNGYSYSGSGAFETEMYLTGGTATAGYRWHYISSPVSSVATDVFTANPATLDLAQYVETLVTTNDNSTGWVAFDGYVYNSGSTNLTYRFDNIGLLLGKGYNYYCAENATRTIIGSPNYSDITVFLSCGTGDINYRGFNLIGNPFSSSIDWDDIYIDLPPEVNDAIYFTTEGRTASYVGGIATGNGSNVIVPMQGFFVKLNQPAENISLTLPASARIHNLSQIRYKGSDGNQEGKSTRSDLISFVRLNIENNEYGDDAVVRFDSSATEAVDKRFDAYKFSKTAGEVDIWTTAGEVDFSINGLPFPETTMEIPVGINVKTTGIYRLSSKELNKLDKYAVHLKDLVTNTQVNLKLGGFIEFNATAGKTENRFILTISELATGTSEVPHGQNPFTLYSSHGYINIVSQSENYLNVMASVAVYDLTGRRVFLQHNVEWSGMGDTRQIMLNTTSIGMYIVEIKAANRKFSEKVVLRR